MDTTIASGPGRWTPRRLTRLAVLGALLPLLTALLLVRPATGQETVFGLYALTASGGPVVLGGDLGAGGGLAVLDGGAPFGAVRLDASPSSSAKAAAIEPGTLFRTVVGVVNTEAGEQIIEVPTAEASYPGDQQESDGDALGSFEEAGGRLAGATAHVEAHAYDALVRAEVGQMDLGGGAVVDGGTLDILSEADPAAGVLTTTVTSRATGIDIGGVLLIDSVVGTATTAVGPDGRAVGGSTVVAGASVGGTPVAITDEGVVADGSVVVPAGPLGDAQTSVNDVLANAGITVEVLQPREDEDGGSLVGDSGGLRVTIVTTANAAVPGNTVVLTFGKATATSADEPPPPSFPDTVAAPAASPPPPSTSSSSSITSTVTAPSAGQAPSSTTSPETPAPVVAAGSTDGAQLLVAGRRLPARAVLAAFGGWQLLSLSTCTLAVYALRRETFGGVA